MTWCGCREDRRADLLRARHRLATFLCAASATFPGRESAGRFRHRHWLSQQQFDDQPSRIT
jgi:hypothetical protein